MAIAITPEQRHRAHRVYRSPQQGKPGEPWRLPPNHQRDLTDIARGLEETNAGVCTRYLFDEMTAHYPDDGEEQIALYEAERFCDRFNVWAHPTVKTWRKKIHRARHALARTNSKHVAILHITYGYPDPATRTWPKPVTDYLQELTSLVRYTEVVEEWRRKMIRALVIKQVRDVPTRAGNCEPKDLHMLINMTDVRERERYLERVVSSGDALREALAPENAHLRPAFLTRAKAGACSMLTEASRAYHHEWMSAAS